MQLYIILNRLLDKEMKHNASLAVAISPMRKNEHYQMTKQAEKIAIEEEVHSTYLQLNSSPVFCYYE